MEARDNEELRKLIAENPNLPLVFYVPNDEMAWDYASTVYEGCYCEVGTLYFDDEQTYDDFEDIVNDYRDYLCEEEEYNNLEEEEYDKAVEKYVNDNIRHYKAIIIRVH